MCNKRVAEYKNLNSDFICAFLWLNSWQRSIPCTNYSLHTVNESVIPVLRYILKKTNTTGSLF
jgi:hypothetical protein